VIGLDTNVLVRFLTRDDPEQARAADAVMSSLTADDPGFVATVVWVELYWVLHRAMKLDRHDVLDRIEALSISPEIHAEDLTGVSAALGAARSGADFPDALIATAASRAGCREVVSFDRRAADRLGWREL
jgi:predicted nucleic-acid-binding protein